MKTRWLTLALLLSLGLCGAPAIRAVSDKTDSDKISRLISQLASMKFSERQKASRELEGIGAPALPALRKALGSADMETCSRAKDLVARIEKKVETAAILAPTRVHLVCKDMPVTEAIAQLGKKAKVELKIDPNSQAKLAQRKVTIDTGEVTYWEALDQLCQKAGLVETTLPNGNIRFANPVLPQFPRGVLPVRPPIKIAPQKIGGFQVLPAKPVQPQQIQIIVIGQGQGQIQIQGMQPAFPVMPAQNNGEIFLADGKPEIVPTCYAGAFRIRARASAGKDKLSTTITFDVAAEPRLQGWTIVGTPRLDKAADDQGQTLALLMEEKPSNVEDRVIAVGGNIRWVQARGWDMAAPSSSMKRTAEIRIKLGAKQATLLKELKGILTVQAQHAPEDLIVVDNILKADGKITKGAKGGSLKVLEIGKDKNGNHQVRFKLENPPNVGGSPANQFGGIRAVQLQGQGRIIINQLGGFGGLPPSSGDKLTLVDAKGAPFQMIGSASQSNNGDTVQTLTFQAQQGREPAKLVFSGQRNINVDLPFTFKDLKLP